MLVVDAREIARGRLLAVEPDVLDLGRASSGAIFMLRIWNYGTIVQESAPQVAKVLGLYRGRAHLSLLTNDKVSSDDGHQVP